MKGGAQRWGHALVDVRSAFYPKQILKLKHRRGVLILRFLFRYQSASRAILEGKSGLGSILRCFLRAFHVLVLSQLVARKICRPAERDL